MRLPSLKIFLLLLCLFALPASAATYYVNCDTGVNTTEGYGTAPETPWKNISYAATMSAVSDTIYVAAGTYNAATGESFPISITQRNFVSTLTYLATIDAGTDNTAVLTLSTNATLDGFTVLKGSTNGVNAINVTAAGASILNCLILNSISNTTYGRAVNANLNADYLLIKNSIIRNLGANSHVAVYLTNGADHPIIQSCTIEIVNNSAGDGYGIYSTGTDYPTFEGNTIWANKGIAEAADCASGRVINNVIHAYGSERSYGMALRHSHTVTGNLVYDYNASGNYGILFSTTGGTSNVNNNTLVNNMVGLQANVGTVNAKNNIICNYPFGIGIIYSIGLYANGGTINSSYNDVFNNTDNYSGCSAGTGDLARNPRFVSAEASDYRTYADSPCASGGDGTYMGYLPAVGSNSIVTSECWVDAGAVNDNGPGDILHPWQKISTALKYTDYFINVQAGTYSEPSGLGLAQYQYLRSIASPATSATIDAGANSVNTVSLGNSTTIEGFYITASNVSYKIFNVLGDNARIRNNLVNAAGASGIVVNIDQTANYCTIEGNNITTGRATLIDLPNQSGSRTSYLAIRNNYLTCTNTGGRIVDFNAENTDTTNYFTFTGNTAECNSYVLDQAHYVNNQTVTGNKIIGIGSGADYGIVLRSNAGTNICSSNEVRNFRDTTYGYGIYISSGTFTISNNTVLNSRINLYRAGGSATVKNNIVAVPIATNIGQNYGINGASLTCDYNDVWNNTANYTAAAPGANDIASNPRFYDPAANDYRIYSDSSCAAAGEGGGYQGCYAPSGASGYNAESWVDASRPDDTGTGTSEAQAFKTISKAVKYTDGLIRAKAGNYNFSANGESFPIILSQGQTLRSVASPTILATIDAESQTKDAIIINGAATIEGFKIKGADTNYYMVEIYGPNAWIKNNTIEPSGSSDTIIFIYDNADHATIEGNTINSGRAYFVYLENGDARADYLTVKNNTFTTTHTSGSGIYFPAENYKISNNLTCIGNTFSGFRYGINELSYVNGQTVSNNKFIGATGTNGYSGIALRSSSGTNLINNNEIRGFNVTTTYGGIYVNGGTFSINNNTVVKNVFGIRVAAGTANTSNNIVSNKPDGTAPAAGSYGIYRPAGAASSIYDDVWNCETNWSPATITGVGTISADPVFTDQANNDYTLLPGSPCIGTGTPEGTDMGAYDYDGPTISVNVKTPNGGETWGAGTWHNITWESTGTPDNFRLYYITSEAEGWQSITAEASGTSYAWLVPNKPTSTARVSIEAVKGTEIATDESNAVFNIFAATDFYVDANIGSNSYNGLTSEVSRSNGPWKTITWASTQAATGSTIHVAAGTYNAASGESFPITIASRKLVANTTLLATVDAGSGNALILGASATLEGFSVRSTTTDKIINVSGANAYILNNNLITSYSVTSGSDIYIMDAGDYAIVTGNTIDSKRNCNLNFATSADYPTIRNNSLTNAYASQGGININWYTSQVSIEGNTVRADAGIKLGGPCSDFMIRNNTCIGYSTDTSSIYGIYVRGTGTVASNEVRGYRTTDYNNWGAIRVYDGTAAIKNNTLVNNIIGLNNGGTAVIQNNIISSAPQLGVLQSGSIAIRSNGTTATSYNDLFNNSISYLGSGFTSANDIVACPRFVNSAANDYRLFSDSPCAAGATSSEVLGRYGALAGSSGIINDSYVSNSGNNSNTGTSEGQAWQTITRALTSTEAVINVLAGTYTAGESYNLNLSVGQYLRSIASPTYLATIDAGSSNLIVMGRDSTLEGFTLKSTTTDKVVQAVGNNVSIKNNSLVTSYAVTAGSDINISADGDGVVVEGNTIDSRRASNINYDNGADYPVVKNNILTNAGPFLRGISIAWTSIWATIEGNVITADFGIYMGGTCSNMLVRNNRIAAYDTDTNAASGMYLRGSGTITSNEVRGYKNTSWAGIFTYDGSSITIDRNTIVKNIRGLRTGVTNAAIKNNIISNKPDGSSPDSGSIGIYRDGGTVDLTYNDVWKNATNYYNCAAGTGTVTLDAKFADSAGNDFHLKYNSPCIDAGDPASSVDPDGSRADMGAYPFNQTTSATPAVYVITPNSGEALTGLSNYNITWYSTHDGYSIDHIELYYSTDGGITYPGIITTNTVNDGSYLWPVPDTPTIQARIKVVAIGSIGTDESDGDFSITSSTPPSIEVISPNGGEKWQVGYSHNITWTPSATPDATVNIYRTIGAGWAVVTSEASDTGSYAWTVPDLPTTEAMIRIEKVIASQIATDESNAKFSLMGKTVVFNCNDTGEGSLRQAMSSVEASGSVSFNIGTLEAGISAGETSPGLVTSGADKWFRMIVDSAELPTININNVQIRGSTQPTSEANNSQGPEIEVRQKDGAAYNGFTATSNYCTLEGMVINGFYNAGVPKNGIYINGGDYNQVRGCYIGTTASGEVSYENYTGIYIYNFANNNIIGGVNAEDRNIISGSHIIGISIGTSSNSNEVKGNYIGVDRLGSSALQNGFPGNAYGVSLTGGSSYNKIGGPQVGEGNIISGNHGSGSGYGINLNSAHSNEIKGNYVGVNYAGEDSGVGNGTGIRLSTANYNVIGGMSALERNIISDSWSYGISLYGHDNTVKGNYIGTNASGTLAVANNVGIYIYGGASSYNNIIGSSNLIARNTSYGIYLASASSNFNQITMNTMEANGDKGIYLVSGANEDVPYPGISSAIIVAGTTTIVGTAQATSSVEVFKTEATPDPSGQGEGKTYLGTVACPDGNWMLTIEGLALGNKVTATTTTSNDSTSEFAINATVAEPPPPNTVINCLDSGAGSLRQVLTDAGPGDNIIFDISLATAGYSTGESYPGLVTNEGTSNTWFRIIVNSNLPDIITNDLHINGLTQTRDVTNPMPVEVRKGAGSDADVGFFIAANNCTIEGLVINGFTVGGNCAVRIPAHNYNQVLNNYIGTTATGEAIRANYHGVYIDSGSQYNLVKGNLISGNSNGIYFDNASRNDVKGNKIGVDKDGLTALANGNGITLQSGNYIAIGGSLGSERNIISGNSSYGIFLSSGSSNEVKGNYIGLATDGTARGNGAEGIYVAAGLSFFNIIGGNTTYEGNYIGANGANGIQMNLGNDNINTIKNNAIGLAPDGVTNRKNAQNGIYLNTSRNNLVESNVISGHDSYRGIYLQSANNNRVIGNRIGTSRDGTTAVGNSIGIHVVDGASNTIGGSLEAERNLFSGNSSAGVYLEDTASNEVRGNYIGTDPTGSSSLPNGEGVIIRGSDNNAIGGDSQSYGNVISGNANNGIYLWNCNANNQIKNNIIGLNAGRVGALPNSSSGIRVNGLNALIEISSNEVKYNSDYGINILSLPADNRFQFRYGTIEANALGGAVNGTTYLIDCQYNNWGSAAGPNDPENNLPQGRWFNPGGDGQSVTDYVDYRYWMGWGSIVPAAPDSFGGTAASSSSINWNWNDNTTREALYYVVESPSRDIKVTSAAGATATTESGLLPYTEYTRRAVAWKMDASSESSAQTVRTLATEGKPTVEVTYPNGGEKLKGGVTCNITFDAVSDIGIKANSVSYYYTTGESWVAINTGQPTDAAYAWTTPLISTTEAKVRVTVLDIADRIGTGESDNFFSIDSSPPIVDITYPDGGETLRANRNYNITFTCSDLSGIKPNSADVYYTTGESWVPIATGQPTNSACSWTTPLIVTTEAKVRVMVQDIFDNAGTGESASYFTIDITPSVEVTYPSGGQYLKGGSVYNIAFTATSEAGIKPNTAAFYYTTGEGWVTIATGQPTDAVFLWTAPLLSTTQAKVRVTVVDNTDRIGTDESDAFFAIDSLPPVVGVIAPNGGERWAGGSSQNITWTATDNIGLTTAPITLKYSVNNGGSYDQIIAGETNDGTYPWLVPAANTTEAKVSVTAEDLAGNITTDESNTAFIIDSANPFVISVTPTNGATSIAVSTEVMVVFSKEMSREATQNAFDLSASPGVAGAFTWNAGGTSLTFRPSANLENNKLYHVNLAQTAVDLAGNPLTAAFSSSFTTVSQGDDESPHCIIQVVDRDRVASTLKRGDYISKRPWIRGVITDNLALDSSSVKVYLNDVLLTPVLNIISPQRIEANYQFTSDLEDETLKSHTFKLEAKDGAGNTGVKQVPDLKVASGAARITGPVLSYPQTFKPKSGTPALLVYNLTADADIMIYLFSTSGENVWVAKCLSGGAGGRAGYNEVSFDGRSLTNGTYLGNGIYTYKITANQRVIGTGYITIFE